MKIWLTFPFMGEQAQRVNLNQQSPNYLYHVSESQLILDLSCQFLNLALQWQSYHLPHEAKLLAEYSNFKYSESQCLSWVMHEVETFYGYLCMRQFVVVVYLCYQLRNSEYQENRSGEDYFPTMFNPNHDPNSRDERMVPIWGSSFSMLWNNTGVCPS